MVYTRVCARADSGTDSGDEDGKGLPTPFSNTPAPAGCQMEQSALESAGAVADAAPAAGRDCLIDLTANSHATQPGTQQEDDLLGVLEHRGGMTQHAALSADASGLRSHHSASTPELSHWDPFGTGAPATQPTVTTDNQQLQQAPPALHKSASARMSGPSAGTGTDGGQDAAAAVSPRDSEVLDFEEEDGARETRELLLYALPLYQDDENPVQGLVFLPVSNFCEEQPDANSLRGKMKARMDKMAAQWDQLKEKEEGTLGKKIYKVGHSVANDLTPEERLTRAIPKNVTKVIIYHPSTIPPDIIMERLSAMTDKHGTWTSAKAAVATFMLPIAFGIDILVIPGPQVLTYYTAFQLYKNARSAVGNQRLTKLIKQEGEAATVRINYAGDVRLDAYWDSVQHSHDGVLDEELCEQLVADIDQPDLLEPLLELRKRRLRELGTRRGSQGGASYQPLRSAEVHPHDPEFISSQQGSKYLSGGSR